MSIQVPTPEENTNPSEEFLTQDQLDILARVYTEHSKVYAELLPNKWILNVVLDRILNKYMYPRDREILNREGLKILDLGAGGLGGIEDALDKLWNLMHLNREKSGYVGIDILPELVAQGMERVKKKDELRQKIKGKEGTYISPLIKTVNGNHFEFETAQKAREALGGRPDFVLMFGATDLWEATKAEKLLTQIEYEYCKEGTEVFILHFPEGNAKNLDSNLSKAARKTLSTIRDALTNPRALTAFTSHIFNMTKNPLAQLAFSKEFQVDANRVSTLPLSSFKDLIKKRNGEIILNLDNVGGFSMVAARFTTKNPSEA